MTAATVRWIAGKDGIAHAQPSSGHKTLCGKFGLPDRYAWPTRTRCAVCVARADEQAAGA